MAVRDLSVRGNCCAHSPAPEVPLSSLQWWGDQRGDSSDNFLKTVAGSSLPNSLRPVGRLTSGFLISIGWPADHQLCQAGS